MYAVGKIPGGWGRREGRPSEQAILLRMIDRPLARYSQRVSVMMFTLWRQYCRSIWIIRHLWLQ